MREHVAAETEEAEAPAPAAAATAGHVARVLTLQRSAGNRAVTQLLAREPVAARAPDFTPTNFVFILGPKDDEALKSAEQYYRSVLVQSTFTKVLSRDDMADPTLAGVLDYLSTIRYPLTEITLVTHGNDEGKLWFPLNSADTDETVDPDELDKAFHDGVLRPLTDGQITDSTRIRLQACFSGQSSRMVNLLDRTFGDGAGTVIAPTVEVGYRGDVWHTEGITGWWVTSTHGLSEEEVAKALQAKYGKSLKLDLATYQEDTGTHHAGEQMKDDDEMWAELGRTAKEETRPDKEGKTEFIYVSNAFTQYGRREYENDSMLYTKSVYYSPKDI